MRSAFIRPIMLLCLHRIGGFTMSRAQITRIVPVSDQILLLVFKDTQAEKYDAKYILHQLPGIRPRSEPEVFKSFIRKNEHVIDGWTSNINCAPP